MSKINVMYNGKEYTLDTKEFNERALHREKRIIEINTSAAFQKSFLRVISKLKNK